MTLYVELIMLQHFKAITSHLLKSREITWNHTCIDGCLCKIVHICQGHILGYVYLCLWENGAYMLKTYNCDMCIV